MATGAAFLWLSQLITQNAYLKTKLNYAHMI